MFRSAIFGQELRLVYFTVDCDYGCARALPYQRPKQNPAPLPYLQQKGKHAFDICLEVSIQPENCEATVVSESNFKYMYWSMSQQLAHHTSNGCRVNSGDMMGSGPFRANTQQFRVYA
jgi:hypothetical protein